MLGTDHATLTSSNFGQEIAMRVADCMSRKLTWVHPPPGWRVVDASGELDAILAEALAALGTGPSAPAA